MLVLLTAALAALAGPADGTLQVRASEAVAPCVRSAVAAYEAVGGPAVAVEVGPLRDGADVLVGDTVELTRALEAGRAVDGSEIDVARIPWVLAVSSRSRVRSLDDAARAGADVWVLGGAAGHEARRALLRLRSERVHASTDAAVLQDAPLALVPLSLAGPRDRAAIDLPPLVAQAAQGAKASRPEAARAFLEFLRSADGGRAFAACGSPQP